MTTTDGLLYLIDDRTRERLEFQFVPLELAITRSIAVDGVQIIGRNTPRYEQTGGEKTVSFKLDFHSIEANKEDAIEKARWIESRSYTNGYKGTASKFQLVYGQLFKHNELWIIKSCPYTVSQFDKQNGFMPCQVNMELTLGLDAPRNLRPKDVY